MGSYMSVALVAAAALVSPAVAAVSATAGSDTHAATRDVCVDVEHGPCSEEGF